MITIGGRLVILIRSGLDFIAKRIWVGKNRERELVVEIREN